MSRTRAGRKAQETHREYLRAVGNFAGAMAEKKWTFDAATTRAMIIEKEDRASGRTFGVTFSQAYAEISRLLNTSFSDITEDGLSDMLCAEFFQGSKIYTRTACYKLWKKN